MELHVEDHPDPLDVELLEAHIRSEASIVKGLGDEVELAIFVRDAGTIVAGISGWTWGDCCELQSLWVAPHLRGRGLATRLLAAAEAEAATRGCSQTVHFTYDFRLKLSTSETATNSWVGSRTFHQEPTLSGTANASTPPGLAPRQRAPLARHQPAAKEPRDRSSVRLVRLSTTQYDNRNDCTGLHGHPSESRTERRCCPPGSTSVASRAPR